MVFCIDMMFTLSLDAAPSFQYLPMASFTSKGSVAVSMSALAAGIGSADTGLMLRGSLPAVLRSPSASKRANSSLLFFSMLRGPELFASVVFPGFTSGDTARPVTVMFTAAVAPPPSLAVAVTVPVPRPVAVTVTVPSVWDVISSPPLTLHVTALSSAEAGVTAAVTVNAAPTSIAAEGAPVRVMDSASTGVMRNSSVTMGLAPLSLYLDWRTSHRGPLAVPVMMSFFLSAVMDMSALPSAWATSYVTFSSFVTGLEAMGRVRVVPRTISLEADSRVSS